MPARTGAGGAGRERRAALLRHRDVEERGLRGQFVGFEDPDDAVLAVESGNAVDLPAAQPGEEVAALDLGSNSFHLVVARLYGGELFVLDRLIARGLPERVLMTALGRKMRDTPAGRILPAVIAEASVDPGMRAVLTEFISDRRGPPPPAAPRRPCSRRRR